MHEQRNNPARLLAPVALVIVALALLIVLLSSGGEGGGSSRPASSRSASDSRQTTAPASARRRIYRVKTGDTLGAIAGKTGVSVDKLLELNPQLDPQALVSGQKVKLRE